MIAAIRHRPSRRRSIAAGGGGALLLDTFTGPDATALGLHTMDVGPGWAGTGGYAISSNKAIHSGSDFPSITQQYADAGAADVTIDCDIAFASSAAAGLVFNVQDDNNLWLLISQSAGFLTLYKKVAGSFTGVDNFGSLSFPVSAAIQIITAGDEMTIKIDGATVHNSTPASRPFKTATKHGITTNWTDGTSTFDNFQVN